MGEVKPIRQIVADVRKAVGGAFFFTRKPVGGVASYDPGSRAVAIKPNDVKSLAHEMGHQLDDRHRLLPTASPEAVAEIMPLAQGGSTAPKNHPNPARYAQGEAVAEWLRRYILQPDATRQQFPEFTKHYEDTVPEKARQAITTFSNDVRIHLSDPLATNIEFGAPPKPGLRERLQQRLQGKNTPGNPIWFDLWDRFLGDWVDPLHPFQKAEDYLRRVTEQEINRKDAHTIVNQTLRLYDLLGKVGDMAERGMRPFKAKVNEDSRGIPTVERIIDPVTGVAKTDEWLFAPYATANGDHAAAKAKREYAGKVGVARRTLALWRDRVAGRVEDVLDEGGTVDPAWLAKQTDLAKRELVVTEEDQASTPQQRTITFEEANLENIARHNKQGKTLEHKPIEEGEGDTPLTGLGRGVYSDVDAALRILEHFKGIEGQDPDYAKDVEEGLRRYGSLANDILEYLKDSGRLSAEQFEAITKGSADYIALQRIMDSAPGEEIENTFTATPKRGLGGGQKVVHRFKGSSRSIKDPWVSLLNSRVKSIDAADRNAVLRSWRDLAMQAREMYDPTQGSEADGPGNLMRQVAESKDGNLTIYVDGKAEFWQVDKAFLQHITEFGEVLPGNMVTKIIGITKQLLTKTPQFALRNAPRDLLEGLVTSNSGQMKGLKNLADPTRRAAADEILEAGGGSQGGITLRTEADYHREIDRTLARVNRSKKDFATRAGDVGRLYMKAIEKTERWGRRREASAAYQKARAEGMSPEDAMLTAALEARGMMDFARAGRVARKVNLYLPFFTARIAGLRKMVASGREMPAHFALRYARYVLVPVMLEHALIAMMGREDEYQQKSASEKQGFFNIPLPDGGWFMIAKPFEIGASASYLTSLIEEHAFGVERASEGQFDHLKASFLPAEDIVPGGAVKAALEIKDNRDSWRDKSIIPAGEEKLNVEYRHTEKASRLGQAIQAISGDNIDARYTDHFITQTTGAVGRMALNVSDTGREGKGLSLRNTGMYSEDPVAHARDVEWLTQKFAEHGLSKAPAMQRLKKKLNAYHAEGDPDMKRELGEQVRELARFLREQFDEEDIEQMRYRKDHPRSISEDYEETEYEEPEHSEETEYAEETD